MNTKSDTAHSKLSQRAKFFISHMDQNVKADLKADLKLEIITAIRRQKFLLIVFRKNSKKPALYISYRTLEKRTMAILKYILAEEKSVVKKELDAAKKKAWSHSLSVGDVFYSTWGYDQTNISYFEIVAIKGKKSVVVKEVNKKVVDTTDYSDLVVPDKGNFYNDKEMVKRVSINNTIKLDYTWASLWDGEPKSEDNIYNRR